MNTLIYGVLKLTFDKLRSLYDSSDEQKYVSAQTISRLVFPKYRENGVRVSEQELRFTFIDAFNQYCNKEEINDTFYSVETPTEDKYTFSENRTKIDPIIGKGQSGNFDLTLLDGKYSKESLIEFKAGYVTEQAFKEVLAKLANPQEIGVTRLVVHMVEDTLSDTCRNNLRKATIWLYEKSKLDSKANVIYKCVSLTGAMSPICYTIEDIYKMDEKGEIQDTQSLAEILSM